MRALVQMYVFSEDCVFIAATDADHSGHFRMFTWGDDVGILDIPLRTAGECDEYFLKYHESMLGQADGPPIEVAVPDMLSGEHHDAWLRRAMHAMEEQAMERLLARL